jgi:hypothetical protein
MTVVYEIAVRADADEQQAVRRWFEARPAQLWRKLPQLRGFDAYFPSTRKATDPYVDDGAGPRLLCIMSFPDREALRASVMEPDFRVGLAGLPPAC